MPETQPPNAPRSDIPAAVQAALDIPRSVAEIACRLIEGLLGGPMKVASGMLADQVYAWCWKIRIQSVKRTEEIMEEDEIMARVVSPSFLFPLLDAAGDVENPDLQEMWARLLVSGVADVRHQHPSFVHVLKQLSSDDAQGLLRSPRTLQVSPRKDPYLHREWELGAASNLAHLGLLDRADRNPEWAPDVISIEGVTGFGARFLDAVAPSGEGLEGVNVQG